ncbi:tungstate transport system substrate-binding protein [Tindallia magadiensis]|uniref:Tungstate transport system substrate-binding protein n=1 Tax=Tindallia magadiensis TaxID=69895 RepID=A0A1I3HB72_9FIRM|nr:substrate-binding domain-containing protein [Tindallia magadiensis]SFI32869.1 tungstate transport system substrate-binding protein [Tindallia magadiensis]
MVKKARRLFLIMLLLMLTTLTSCGNRDESVLILATTTSTENSGLLDYILPDFEEKKGIDVRVVAVGTGAALQMGISGEADVLMTHAAAQEEKLVEAGHTIERFDLMYNDFILIGPADDPGSLREKAAADIITGFEIIAQKHLTFVSRADHSGTHVMEGSLWENTSVGQPSGDWYIEAGQGMGDVIQMANEMEGHTLTDRATYLSMLETIDLEILLEGDAILFNQYGVMAVNPMKSDAIHFSAAEAFLDWILAPETQDLIAAFGIEEFGESLFVPNAK